MALDDVVRVVTLGAPVSRRRPLMLSRYRREIDHARLALANPDYRVVHTPAGEIQYASQGAGPPVLWVHGVFGGVDHGLAIAREFGDGSSRAISVSRFGYVGSPLPADASAAAQADHFAALLDTLAVERAALVATSAGTASAFRFAQRHPQRCSAIAIFSMAVPPYAVPPRPALWANRAFFRSNFLFWMTMRYTPFIRRLMGIPRSLEGHLSADDERFVREVMDSFLPASARGAGVVNDICLSNPDLNELDYLSRVDVPMLFLHARDDPWGAFEGARQIVGRIPGARFVGFESGGHLLLGHHEEARKQIAGFLAAQAGIRATEHA